MAPLKLAAAALAMAFATPVAAESVTDWRSYIAEASLRFGVPVEWIERVMRVESDGQTTLNGRPIRSRVGAIGLMQLMPGTWEMLRNLIELGSDPDDPRDNILAGTLYLRMMYDRFGYPGLFAAYNAGPRRFAAHLVTDRAPPRETIVYLRKVAGSAQTPLGVPERIGRDRLFVVGARTQVQPAPAASQRSVTSLFVVRDDVH